MSVKNKKLSKILSDGDISFFPDLPHVFIFNVLAPRSIFFVGAHCYESNQGRHTFLRRWVALNASLIRILNCFLCRKQQDSLEF